MIEKNLGITTKDGEMETFICHPERNGPSPAVFLLMDAHGVREELKDMAVRITGRRGLRLPRMNGSTRAADLIICTRNGSRIRLPCAAPSFYRGLV